MTLITRVGKIFSLCNKHSSKVNTPHPRPKKVKGLESSPPHIVELKKKGKKTKFRLYESMLATVTRASCILKLFFIPKVPLVGKKG